MLVTNELTSQTATKSMKKAPARRSIGTLGKRL
jgi:hypothetical protein